MMKEQSKETESKKESEPVDDYEDLEPSELEYPH
jgi:hypothetical protein